MKEKVVMPDDLKAMLLDHPNFFTPDVSIVAPSGASTEEIESRLSTAGVTYTVRRMGHQGVSLVARGLRYSGTTAVDQFLSDRSH